MELQLKNIGMIKEANVKIDGLTVIAGENDTGKSTVGKALYILLEAINFIYKIVSKREESGNFSNKEIKKIIENEYSLKDIFENTFKHALIFRINLKGAKLKLTGEDANISFLIDEDNFLKPDSEILNIKVNSFNSIFVESPLVWNFTDFFRDIAQIESQMNIKLDYPYLMKDLNFKLHIKSSSNGLNIKEKVTKLMGGEFKKDEMGRYYFDKVGQRIELVNTATGIKSFGILQVLSQNNWLNEDTVLIFDEPEVHLHPKWQLEMAKILVELVKNGVKIVVNSHSPYMVEALKRYAEVENVYDKTNFYLAEDGFIKQLENSNAQTLSKIFEKLSEPFNAFEEMESDSLEKLING